MKKSFGGISGSRPLRYIPVMRQLTPEMSAALRGSSAHILGRYPRSETRKPPTREAAQQIKDPSAVSRFFRSTGGFYPDGSVASHVVGFLNAVGEAQYGIERTFNPLLRGQEGMIATVSDPQGPDPHRRPKDRRPERRLHDRA